MKKLLIVLVITILLIAADTPPALPSSFWGTVSGKIGQTVTVSIGWNVIAKTQTFLWNGQVVYSVDIPMGEVGNPVKEGTIAAFKINGITVGSAQLHSGTIVNLNLAISRGWFGR